LIREKSVILVDYLEMILVEVLEMLVVVTKVCSIRVFEVLEDVS
jgi:hypothetical protein